MQHCQNCRFFSHNLHLSCAVNPAAPLARECRDWEPKEQKPVSCESERLAELLRALPHGIPRPFIHHEGTPGHRGIDEHLLRRMIEAGDLLRESMNRARLAHDVAQLRQERAAGEADLVEGCAAFANAGISIQEVQSAVQRLSAGIPLDAVRESLAHLAAVPIPVPADPEGAIASLGKPLDQQ